MNIISLLEQLADHQCSRSELLKYENDLSHVYFLHRKYKKQIPYFRALPYRWQYVLVVLVRCVVVIGVLFWFWSRQDGISIMEGMITIVIGLIMLAAYYLVSFPSEIPYQRYLTSYVNASNYANNQELLQVVVHDLRCAKKELYLYAIKQYHIRCYTGSVYRKVWKYAEDDPLLEEEKRRIKKKYNLCC